MKLLIVTPGPSRGGTEEYALTVSKGAVAMGWDVHAAFPHTAMTESYRADYIEAGVRCHKLNLHRVGHRAYRDGVNLAKSLLLLLRLRPDVVLINLPWPHAAVGPVAACAALRIPTVVVFHLVAKDMIIHPMIGKLLTWARQRNQRWVAVSDFNGRIVSEAFGVPLVDIKTIYNGTTLEVESSDENRAARRAELLREFGLDKEAKLLLSVGRLCEQKGYHVLVPAIADVVKAHDQVKFLWVGDGEDKQKLLTMLQSNGLEDRVLFLGRRNDVMRLMLGSDLFVFPTLTEGLPFVLLEAMAAGLPVVATDASSIPEIVRDGTHGVLCPANSATRLRDALLWALAHPDEMRQMAILARVRCLDFPESAMVDGILTELKAAGARENEGGL